MPLRPAKLSELLFSGGTLMLSIQLGSRFFALVLSIILVRALGAEAFGHYAFAIALISVTAVGAEFGFPMLLERSVATAVARRDWPVLHALLRYLDRYVLVTGGAFALVIVLIACSLSDQAAADVLLSAALLVPLSALLRCWCSHLAGFGAVQLSRALELIGRPLLMIGLVLLTTLTLQGSFSATDAMLAQIICLTITLLLALLCRRRLNPMPKDCKALQADHRGWLRSARSIALTSASVVVVASAGMVIMGFLSTAEETGAFRIVAQIATLTAIGHQAAKSLLAPRVAALWSQQRQAELQQLITTSVRWVSLLALVVLLLFALEGKALLTFLYGEEYASAYLPLLILATGQLGQAAFGSGGFLLNMTGHERVATRPVFIAAIVCILLCGLLIPPWGTMGAALATAGSTMLWNLLHLTALRSHTGLRASVLGS